MQTVKRLAVCFFKKFFFKGLGLYPLLFPQREVLLKKNKFMGTKENIIMYDSPEAGRLVTVTVWEVDNPNGIIYTPKEEVARYNNCTHKVCECGKPMDKYYLKCEDCRNKSARERFDALPFKEWNGEPVVEYNGDEYFFTEEDLMYYLDDHDATEIDLLFCEPIYYTPIDMQNIADDCHEDWEPEKELTEMVNKFNEELKKFKPHSWKPGKIRTHYKLQQENPHP